MKKKLLFLLLSCSMLLAGCGKKEPAPDLSLADKVPVMDRMACNQFEFQMTATAADEYGAAGNSSTSGTIEMQGMVAHSFLEGKEVWTDYSTGQSYTYTGESWEDSMIEGSGPALAFEDAINNRETNLEVVDADGTCTVSWEFQAEPVDVFGALLPVFLEDREMTGSGRVTTVLDPDSHQFDYFNFTYTATDGARDGMLLEAVIHWDVVNDEYTELQVPQDIAGTAYTDRTGVVSDGYDDDINPIAEALLAEYGGTADVTVYDTGAAMFWTATGDMHSVTVACQKEGQPDVKFRGTAQFLRTIYGEPAEETATESYFYSEDAGQLVYCTYKDGVYIEITITGQSGDSQGTLRKPLITYRSKLGL